MDQQLLKSLKEHQNDDNAISKATLAKISNHLWYLSEELVGSAPFFLLVPIETKAMMVKTMRERPAGQDALKRVLISVNSIAASQIPDFVSEGTLEVFKKLGIKSDFLELNLGLWADNKRAQEIIQALIVTKIML